jgi:phytanoyl-CoA hydroxylase
MFFNKPMQHATGIAGGTALPWHQDRWRYLDRDPLLNAYLALDEATPAAGCVRLLPRSHRLGVINPAHHSAFLTDEQAAQLCGADALIIDLELRPGECALIHNWVIHSSGLNATARSRRALSVSFMDARTTLDDREFGGFLGGEHKSAGYPEGGMSFPLIFGATEPAR